jgi:hypothetical protein
MPTIITENGRISVPKTREKNGREQKNLITVKVSGWVKYRKNGEFHHIPPNRIVSIEETDPEQKEGVHGDETYPDSNVCYQNPHGRV